MQRVLSVLLFAVLTSCGGGDGGGTPTPPPPPPPTPVIDLTVGTVPATIVSGTEASIAVTLSRTHTTADVALTVEGLTTGITAVWSSTSVAHPSTTSSLRIVIAPGTLAHAQEVRVRARATGAADVVRTIAFAVVDPPPTPEIRVALANSTLAVRQGQSGTVTLSITRLGGFTAPVAITIANAPVALGVVASTPSVTGNAVDITVGPSFEMATGPVAIEVVASAAGVATQRASLTVTVSAATYTAMVTPASLTIPRGEQRTASVNLDRSGGYAAPIQIVVDSAPSGVVVSAAPTSIAATATASTLTFAIAATRAPGVVNVGVRLRGAGQSDKTFALAITVPPPVVADSIVITYCGFGPQSIPDFFAVQDGASGAWRRVQPTGNSFRFVGSQAVVSILTTFLGETGFSNVQQLVMTLAEIKRYAAASCRVSDPRVRDVPVNVSGVRANEIARLSGGDTFGSVATGGTSGTLRETVSGPFDLIAVRQLRADSSTRIPNRVAIVRNINPPIGTVVSVGFEPAGSFAVDSSSMTIAGASTPTSTSCELLTVLTVGDLCAGSFQSVATRQYYGMRLADMQPNDLVRVMTSETSLPFTEFSGRTRSVIEYVRATRPLALQFGPDVALPTLSAVNTGTGPRLRAQAAWSAQYNDQARLKFSSNLGGVGRLWNVLITAAARAQATAVDWTSPDVVGIGFAASWLVPPGSTEVQITVNGTLGTLSSGAPTDGTREWLANRSGTVSW